jgi:adenylate cyclase
MRVLRRLVKPRRPRVLVRTLLTALAITAVSLATFATPLGQRLEQRTIDARFAERGTLHAPDAVTIVAIDRTQDSYGNTWPISRSLWAKAITQLDAAGVAGIAIDVPMDWKAFNPSEDAELVDAVRNASVPVVFAERTPHDGAGGERTQPLAGLSRAAANSLPDAKLHAGWSARIPAADGAVREYPTRGSLAAELLAVSGAHDAARHAPKTMLLDQYGPRGSFEQVSFSTVAYGLDALRDMRGKLVLIGPTEGLGRDDHHVPMGSAMPSVEIQANAVANLLDGTWLRQPSPWLGAAAALALALAVWALLLVVPLGLAVPAALALVAAWGWACVAAFRAGLELPMLPPLVAGAATFVTLSLALVLLAVRERVRVKSLFARYVHADVVQELIDGEDQFQLGGEEREITVLFSDIRGFTSLSEHVDPVEMVAQLNEYFEAMVDVVAGEQGTVDKFLGDGLMAIFGAPVRHEDHALRACRAATAMLDRLDQVNADRGERGLAPLRIGIGVHTGRAVVGNVGSPPFRVDFTAIGDTVNLAARIEAMTKELGAAIVVSDATRQAAAALATHGELAFDALGSVVARGRTGSTDVHALRRPADEQAEAARAA